MNPPPESEFEARLRRQPIRPLPGEWRDAILQEARRWGVTPSSQHELTAVPAVSSPNLQAASSSTTRKDRRAGVPTCDRRRWFSFSRLGWTGLAATWVAILALNHAGRPEPLSDLAGDPPAASAAWSAWAWNQRQLARLLETPPALPPSQPFRPAGQQSRLPLALPLA